MNTRAVRRAVNRTPVEEIYAEIGDLVRIERLRQRLTVEQLATVCGYSRSRFADMEAGRKRIALHTLIIIADRLGVPPVDLFPASLLTEGPTRHASLPL